MVLDLAPLQLLIWLPLRVGFDYLGFKNQASRHCSSHVEPISVQPASSLNIEEEIEREFRQVARKIEWNISIMQNFMAKEYNIN